MRKVFHAFENVNTLLGKPWLGKVHMVKEPCIIYGPNLAEDFVYLMKRGSRIYICRGTNVNLLALDGTEQDKRTDTSIDMEEFIMVLCDVYDEYSKKETKSDFLMFELMLMDDSMKITVL